MIRFKCPHCQKTLGVKDHLAGKKAACPACKKLLQIPAPTASPVDLEALAAAALADVPVDKPVAEAADKPILFTCIYCDEEVQVTRDQAGKQVPCPNPECRRIVRVPVPKEEATGPKDWRKIEKKGPSAAKENILEKLDGVMSTRDDKGLVSKESLLEAGAIEAPPARPIGLRGWIRRGLTAVACVALAVTAFLAVSRLNVERRERGFLDETFDELKKVKLGTPILDAEIHRGVGAILSQAGKATKAQEMFWKARGLIPRGAVGKSDAIEQDLFLIDLAQTQVELGGNKDEVLDGVKLPWEDVQKDLLRTLERIASPEARLWGLRDVAHRLLAGNTGEVAIGLAAHLKNVEGARAPVASQEIAIMLKLDKNELLARSIKPPDPAKELKNGPVRVGYAEGLARKGNFAEALALAQAKGPAGDRLQACVGVAAVAVADAKSMGEALPFILKGIEIFDENKASRQKQEISPWLILHLIRVGAQADALVKVEGLIPQLPAEFQPAAELEVFRARCVRTKEAIVPPSAFDGLGKDAATQALALEALSRQHARSGNGEAALQALVQGDAARYRPFVRLGQALGERDGR